MLEWSQNALRQSFELATSTKYAKLVPILFDRINIGRANRLGIDIIALGTVSATSSPQPISEFLTMMFLLVPNVNNVDDVNSVNNVNNVNNVDDVNNLLLLLVLIMVIILIVLVMLVMSYVNNYNINLKVLLVQVVIPLFFLMLLLLLMC